ncbi:MAG: 6-phosphofructokinase [Thermoplasmata archaeon]|nr:6-phosphofructokinase [Thermoplasmata archaeon]MBE3136018.1 6-phosphofructokinase [Thermoplasmata archaeon]MBE3142213.1 6-phosphofructokinase [Thermoplasmata archaeon]
MKKIAIITRDCAGVNAAIRSVVRTACGYKIEVVGVLKGYDGLIDGKFIQLNRGSVSGIINLGGTILKTSRSKRFLTDSGQKQAVKNLHEYRIEGLIVIGGNGSLSGAHNLATQGKIAVVGIPATIDNDITDVDLAIGADTAVNVALDALDKIRDTATSLERIFVVEVMGRESGYIAMQVALAGGCEEVLLPEKESDIEVMCKEIKQGNAKGKSSWIIIVAEGKAKAHDIARLITRNTGFETRVTVLGHIQRGGHPTAVDRILASQLGNYAVEVLRDGQTDICVSMKNDKLVTIPLSVAIQPKKIKVAETYKLIKLLTK